MLPKLLSWDDLFLPTYGVLVAIAFLAALWMTARQARRAGLNVDAVTNLGVNAAIAGLLGAKLLLFIQDFDYYWENPGEFFSFATLQAGGIFFGGLLLALGYASWEMRRKKLPVLATLDAFGPGLALGHAIGRIGCFAAGCCWGLECDRSWAVTFTDPEAHRLVGVPLGIPLHPTQLYEAGAQFLVFGIVYRLASRPQKPGRTMGAYLALSAVARFSIDFFRYHDQSNPFGGPLATAQWIALVLAGAGAGLWFWADGGLKVSTETRQANT
jgi:phosphatidylglycerol:prolipoprotein diacylglycerol transferase